VATTLSWHEAAPEAVRITFGASLALVAIGPIRVPGLAALVDPDFQHEVPPFSVTSMFQAVIAPPEKKLTLSILQDNPAPGAGSVLVTVAAAAASVKVIWLPA
jgi:hypothetical protein